MRKHKTVYLKSNTQAVVNSVSPQGDSCEVRLTVIKMKKTTLVYTHKVNISTKMDLTFFDKFNVKGVNSKEIAKLENCFQSDLC